MKKFSAEASSMNWDIEDAKHAKHTRTQAKIKKKLKRQSRRLDRRELKKTIE
jgi:hypothetical protein